jgi:hypothetical protein
MVRRHSSRERRDEGEGCYRITRGGRIAGSRSDKRLAEKTLRAKTKIELTPTFPQRTRAARSGVGPNKTSDFDSGQCIDCRICLLSGQYQSLVRPYMRFVLFVLSIIASTMTLDTTTKAQNYPWCAIYSGGMGGGGTNCGFTTFQQCMDTARGLGSFCQPNTQYQPPPGPHPTTRALRRYS